MITRLVDQRYYLKPYWVLGATVINKLRLQALGGLVKHFFERADQLFFVQALAYPRHDPPLLQANRQPGPG